MQRQPFWLDPRDPDQSFPDAGLALRDPDGLLAIGGDLGSAQVPSFPVSAGDS